MNFKHKYNIKELILFCICTFTCIPLKYFINLCLHLNTVSPLLCTRDLIIKLLSIKQKYLLSFYRRFRISVIRWFVDQLKLNTENTENNRKQQKTTRILLIYTIKNSKKIILNYFLKKKNICSPFILLLKKHYSFQVLFLRTKDLNKKN